MPAHLRILIPLLASLGSIVYAQPHPSRRCRTSLRVEQYRPGSGTWELLPATARILQAPDSLHITIWNHWSHPDINPLVRIRAGRHPVPDSSRRWRYAGTVFRTATGHGNPCTINSCTKIADTSNPDITITDNRRTIRYRLSPKTLRKP